MRKRRKGFIRNKTLGIMMDPWFSIHVVVKCPKTDIYFLLKRQNDKQAVLYWVLIPQHKNLGEEVFQRRMKTNIKSLVFSCPKSDTINWSVTLQAHTYPASEGMFKIKGVTATAAVLAIKYKSLDNLHTVVRYYRQKSFKQRNKIVEAEPFRTHLICL